MTEALEGESDYFDDDEEVDTKQDSEWQAEMTAIQNTHQSELETIRHHYEHQLKGMRERIEHEEARRRKLQEELVQITISIRSVFVDSRRRMKRHIEREQMETKDPMYTTYAMLEQMREELTNLSAAYSAKCIENAQLDERLSALMEERERDGER
ncbi:hypothetical protein COOONC_26148 [Cooperia oncophora]